MGVHVIAFEHVKKHAMGDSFLLDRLDMYAYFCRQYIGVCVRLELHYVLPNLATHFGTKLSLYSVDQFAEPSCFLLAGQEVTLTVEDEVVVINILLSNKTLNVFFLFFIFKGR